MKKLLPLLIVFLAVPSPAQAAEPGSGFASYTMIANAPGLAIEGLYRDVALTIPETTSTLTTGGVGASLATIAWPGPIAGNAGDAILVLEGSAPPWVTVLNDPIRAQARSGGTQKATYTKVPGTTLTANATNDTVSASSQSGSTTLPIGGLGVLSADTKTAFTGTTGARGTAKGLVQDLNLAGGLIHIGSVVSTAEATTDGVKADGTGSTVVSGMTIAGIPVTVDEKGLHVASTSLPLASKTLTDAVKSLGLTAVLTDPRITKTTGSVNVNAGALALMYTQGASTYAFTIGRASVGLAASRAGTYGDLPLPPLPTGTTPAVTPTLPRSDVPVLDPPGGQAIPPTLGSAPTPSVIETVKAAVVSLSHGATGLATAGLLLVAGMLVIGMKRLPDKVLAVTDAECEEWPE